MEGTRAYVWLDLEMTGLNLETDIILEIACIITDPFLRPLKCTLGSLADNKTRGEPKLHVVINQSRVVMDGMNAWCIEHHRDSGLTADCLASGVTHKQAYDQLLTFIQHWCPDPGSACLAGNSVHVDRQFICKYMPLVTDHLHHRIVDVSTIKELCRHWYPQSFLKAPSKKLSHRALDDIWESIKELEYYRSHIFQSNSARAPVEWK